LFGDLPFEKLHYVSEPVVTMAVEPKRPTELTKLIEALRKMAIEDPNLIVKINEETGEYLISGMGPLHLEIMLTLLKQNYGLEVETSPPIVVYRETIRSSSDRLEGAAASLYSIATAVSPARPLSSPRTAAILPAVTDPTDSLYGPM